MKEAKELEAVIRRDYDSVTGRYRRSEKMGKLLV